MTGLTVVTKAATATAALEKGCIDQRKAHLSTSIVSRIRRAIWANLTAFLLGASTSAPPGRRRQPRDCGIEEQNPDTIKARSSISVR